MKMVLASSNPGKIKEFQTLLAPLKMTVVPQTDFNVAEIAETGLTFVENALIKARYACQQTGLPALADDSGLCVNILRGAPGIYSARYAGEQKDATACINKLLDELNGVPNALRQASFHCVLVYMAHTADPMPLICHGIWHGTITDKPAGQGGFGYDPVFFVPSEHKTAAELTTDSKNRLSHRGQACRILLEKLGSVYNSLG